MEKISVNAMKKISVKQFLKNSQSHALSGQSSWAHEDKHALPKTTYYLLLLY